MGSRRSFRICRGNHRGQVKKGDKVYIEGTLALNTWNDKTTGEAKFGLNVAAWRVWLGNVGKARVWPEKEPPGKKEPEEPAKVEKRREYEFDDKIDF